MGRERIGVLAASPPTQGSTARGAQLPPERAEVERHAPLGSSRRGASGQSLRTRRPVARGVRIGTRSTMSSHLERGSRSTSRQGEPMNPEPARGRWAFLQRPGAWFWALVLFGVGARIFLAIATHGTEDVSRVVRARFACRGPRSGHHYFLDPELNHPPASTWAMSRLWKLARALHVRFRTLFRLVVGLADLVSALLIWRILRESPWRWLASGAYCAAPVAFVLAAYHGNTDCLDRCCLLGCTLFTAQRRPIATGVLLGVSAWIKLPGLLAAPAIGFAFPRWRDRVLCAVTALVVGASTYVGPLSRRATPVEVSST